MSINISGNGIEKSGTCSCVAGKGGYCHHVIGLFFYMAHCKQLGLKAIPDEVTCTSLPQCWSVPRGKKIKNKAVDEIMVKKPRPGADYEKFIKSTLYSPAKSYGIFVKENFSAFDPMPLIGSIAPNATREQRDEGLREAAAMFLFVKSQEILKNYLD